MAFSMNSGYSGWSMSVRATQAYDGGEMPKSKWTKKAMLKAIEDYCDEFDLVFPSELLNSMRKDEVFDRFFVLSSWHHTSKHCNATDFYSIDEDAVCEIAPEMSEEQAAARERAREQAAGEASKEHEEAVRAEAERARRFSEAHRGLADPRVFVGCQSDFLSELVEAYPEMFGEARPSRSGKSLVRETVIAGAVLIEDGHGMRWGTYVGPQLIIEAMEAADRRFE